MLRCFCWLLGGWLLAPAAWAQTAIKSGPLTRLDGYKLLNELCALPSQVQDITLLHGSSRLDSLPEGSTVTRSTRIGRTLPPPPIRSIPYGAELAQAEAAYDEREFARAAELLREPVAHEPDNPFLLNAYARTLYQTTDTKPQSYAVYQRLFRVLATDHPARPTEWTVDFWFLESYWKYGTLCLDRAEWEPAAHAIERFLAGYTSLDSPNEPLLEQALGYLTEAFFELRRPALCRYYGQLTLRRFPQNQYVRPYLARLPKAPGGRR